MQPNRIKTTVLTHESLNQTIDIMNSLVYEYKIHPFIRELCSYILSCVAKTDKSNLTDYELSSIIYKFIRETVKYINDPFDTELVQSPIVTLKYGFGDCDDMAVLSSCLLQCMGLKTNFCLLGYVNNYPEHIVTILNDKICIDPTVNVIKVNPLENLKFFKIVR